MQLSLGNYLGAKRGLPYPTAGLDVIVYNSTYEDGGTTYLRTSKGVGIPLVSGTGLDAIYDFSGLNDERFNKSNATYWGASLNAWFYYDALNPYHYKLRDFHYRYFQNQMASDNNFCFAKLLYENEELISIQLILIYSTEKSDSDLNRLFNYSNIFIFNYNYYYLQEFSGIALYQNDFDIIYYPNSNYVIESNNIISNISDLNNTNNLIQTGETRKPLLSNNKYISFQNRQSLQLKNEFISSFDVGLSDLYIIFGVRSSKFQYASNSYYFIFGGTSDNNGGCLLYIQNALTANPVYWFVISAGDGSPRKFIYGSLTTDLIDNNHHIVEIILNRDIGTSIYIDGIIQTGLIDNTSAGVNYNIVSETPFILNGFANNNGSGNNLITMFGIIKKIPTIEKRTIYRNRIKKPVNDWRLNTHFLLPLVGSSIPIIKNYSVTIFGDALCNVPIENNLSVIYNGIGSVSGNNLTLNISSQTAALDVTIKSGNEFIDHIQTYIQSYLKVSSGSKKILMIGDSTTYLGAAYYFNKLSSIFSGMTLTSLGTQDRDGIKHEGYSGKTYNWMITNIDSPFVKSESLDISSYFTDNSIDIPDIVYMRLGINEMYAYADTNITRAEMIDIITDIKTFITAFLEFDSNLKIIIGIPSICENTGDGWNANYPTYPYQNIYIEIMHYFWQEIINIFFNGAYNARVDVSFGAIFVDRNNDYPKLNGVHTNAVHLTQYGYEHLAEGDAGTFNKLFST